MSDKSKPCPFCDGTGHVPEGLFETRVYLRRWCIDRSCLDCPLRDNGKCMIKTFDYLINYDETSDILLRHLFGFNPVCVASMGVEIHEATWLDMVDRWCAKTRCAACPLHYIGGHGSEASGYCGRPPRLQSQEEAGKKILKYLFGKDILEV